ncbi:hypothetical protein C9439_03225 [archaeon SCG-AAA382B04]|nr:hypothetical protein C9439_03225 [archaeon SCG-AAA382B04]
MEKAQQKLEIIVPSSLTIETDDQKVKTLKIGNIARTASIFRADQITIYRDNQYDESSLIKKILDYAETPPYLKKPLFGISEELRYVGVIPPLQIPSHNLEKEVKVGEYREGFVEEVEEEKVGSDYCARVNIGLDEKALLVNGNVNEAERITVRTISSESPIEVEKVSKEVVPYYWGYETKIVNSLDKHLEELKQGDWKIIATSIEGDRVSAKEEYLDKKTAILFGSPKRGVYAYIDNQRIIDKVLNTIPNQGTKTVRTEEAIHATLSILNIERS